MNDVLNTLDSSGLRQFQSLRNEAVDAVTARIYTVYGAAYEKFGQRGRDACREDLAFHLEFLRPVLEFGLLQPMVDYLLWLGSVLAARAIPAEHLALSLEWLSEFFVERMDSADGAVVAVALREARAGFLASNATSLAPLPLPAPWPEADTFEKAILSGRQYEAMDIVNKCMDAGQDFIDVELHVIQPALYSVGEKWQTNQISVAAEHMATAIVHSVMTAGLLRSPVPARNGKKILLACVEGNNHAVGLRMVTDAFQLRGWDVQYLGASVPDAALIEQAALWKPDLIGLSVSFANQLIVAKGVIAKLRGRFGEHCPAIMIGGLAINRFSQLAGVIGADTHCADSQSAVSYAAKAAAI